jgi:hypothetical protein
MRRAYPGDQIQGSTGIELFGREAHRYQVLAATTMISDALVEYPRSCGSGTSQASRPAYLL